MRSKMAIIVLASLLFSGCSLFQSQEPIKPAENNNEQKISFAELLDQSLQKGALVIETDNPKLTLPTDINSGQIQKYFKIDNILLALVLRNSMNVVLTLPDDFTPSFAGVLIAKQGDTQWTKLTEIKDVNATDKNNPYYLTVENKKLLLTVVDQNGAGSGEGIMKVFSFSDTGNWNLEKCYYFGGKYNDPSTDGDYYAFSTKFSKQEERPLEECNNVQLISPSPLQDTDTSQNQNSNAILFQKDAGYGPCPTNAKCYQHTTLYYSGKLILEGDKNLQKQLSQEELNQIIAKIEETNVMEKECTPTPIVDYSANYTLTVNNQEKKIRFPGCEDELRVIEKLIPTK